MTCRDRTREFLSVMKAKQSKMDNSYMPLKKEERCVKGIVEWKNFMQKATEIGKDIRSTFAKLEKLTLLAKRKSLFDDRPVTIQQLIYLIREDIINLNRQISYFQKISKARSNNYGKHMQSHSNSVVVSLESKLASLSNAFRHILEIRTENLKHQKVRREEFTDDTTSATLPSFALSGHTRSVLISDENVTSKEGEVSISMDGPSVHFQQQIQHIDEQNSYIQNRANAMQNIESTIVDLSTIFKELGHIVKEQEEMIERIDSNVEDARLSVEAAYSEILKFFQSVTSRWLTLKVFIILIIFFIVFAVFGV